MDVRILNYFLAVAQEGNITKAAKRLHITQPSLSKQMIELEKELGKPLLIRGKRKITLTEDGILLRKRAEDIVSLVEKTEQEIKSDSKHISGEISIGGNFTTSMMHTASCIQTQYPEITFQLFGGDATDVIERLDQGNLDFAVLLQPIDTSIYEYIPLPENSIWGVLMKKESSFSNLKSIKKEDLLQMPLILHRRIGLQQIISNWAHTDPSHLHVTATYNIVHGSPTSFVRNNMGYFLLTRDMLSKDLDQDVIFLPLDPPLPVQYYLVWKRRNIFSNASKLFLDKMKGQF